MIVLLSKGSLKTRVITWRISPATHDESSLSVYFKENWVDCVWQSIKQTSMFYMRTWSSSYGALHPNHGHWCRSGCSTSQFIRFVQSSKSLFRQLKYFILFHWNYYNNKFFKYFITNSFNWKIGLIISFNFSHSFVDYCTLWLNENYYFG